MTMSEQAGSRLTKLVIAIMVTNLFLMGYVFLSSYEGRKTTVKTQRAGCERSKKDRADNAEFQSAHKLYIDKVVLAKSVEEDVKAAARTAVETYKRTAADLTIRSQINCAEAFPKARLIP